MLLKWSPFGMVVVAKEIEHKNHRVQWNKKLNELNKRFLFPCNGTSVGHLMPLRADECVRKWVSARSMQKERVSVVHVRVRVCVRFASCRVFIYLFYFQNKNIVNVVVCEREREAGDVETHFNDCG